MKTRLILLSALSIVLLSSCQKEIEPVTQTKTEVIVQPTWDLQDAGDNTAQEVQE
jgi:hypothetical protein